MTCTVTEIAPDTFRLSSFHPDMQMQFNQFLVRDDQPFLVHTGLRGGFADMLEAVRRLIDPASLRWIGFSHFESDECGALNDWLGVAPRAQAVCSFVGATVNLADFALRPARPLGDGEVLATGRHRIQFLATPHLPHGWDAGLFFDRSEGTLFCSDLFFQGGNPQALTEADVVGPARQVMLDGQAGPLAHDMPYTRHTPAMLERLAELEPRVLAAMHGSSFRGDGKKALADYRGVVDELLGAPLPR